MTNPTQNILGYIIRPDLKNLHDSNIVGVNEILPRGNEIVEGTRNFNERRVIETLKYLHLQAVSKAMSSTKDLLDPFNREVGSGSRNAEEDWVDDSSIFGNQWGSTAATTFNPSGQDGTGESLTPRQEKKYKNLYELHNGRGESDRHHTILESYIKNDAKMFMSTLDMPAHQRSDVLNIIQDLDISSQNFGKYRPYEKIILAVCSLVSDKALTQRIDEGADMSIDDRIFSTESFEELMESVGMTSGEHRQIRNRVRDESDYFDGGEL